MCVWVGHKVAPHGGCIPSISSTLAQRVNFSRWYAKLVASCHWSARAGRYVSTCSFVLMFLMKANNNIFNCVFIETEHFIITTPDAQYHIWRGIDVWKFHIKQTNSHPTGIPWVVFYTPEQPGFSKLHCCFEDMTACKLYLSKHIYCRSVISW